MRKELMHMLSMRISSWHICSACAPVPYVYAQHGLYGPLSNLEFLCLCWAYASETDAYAQGTHQFLTRMLSERISSWPVCSGYASVPDAYAQHFLKGMRSVHASVPDAYAQCTHQFLTPMLSVRISSWRPCSVHASVPDAHAQGAHQFLTRLLSMRINVGACA